MKSKLVLRLAALLAMLTVSITANAQIYLGTNLGSPGHAGVVTTNEAGTINVEAGGGDIWNSADVGYFYYTWVQGDFDAKVRVSALVNSSAFASGEWAKAELMVRKSDPAVGVQANDPFIASMAAPNQGNGNQHQYRATRGGGANNVVAGAANTAVVFPDNWLRLTRTNAVITMWASPDNATWTVLATINTAATDYGFGDPWTGLLTIGVAVCSHDDANAAANFTTATFDRPIIAAAGGTWSSPTAATISQDVVNCDTFAGGEASFKFVAANNATPVELPMLYQWYRGGAPLAGVTRNTYTFLATPADVGAQIKCVAWPNLNSSITVTSATATVAFTTTTVQYTNALKMELFANASRNDAEIGNTGTGDAGNLNNGAVRGKLQWLSSFADPGGWGDNTSRRVSGWFIPWTSGNYTFYVASDDDTDVFLSTDATPLNKALICQETGWSGFNNWTTNSDATTNNWNEVASAQKCSDTWTNGAGVAPNATGIALVAGSKYYIELVEHNGGGGDNLGVTAKLFDELAPTNGTPTTLTPASNNIVVVTWVPTMTWVVQPTNFVAVDGSSPILYAPITTTGEMAPHYQWYRAGAIAAGQTKSAFALGQVLAAQNGQQIYCVASVPGLTMTSSVATMTVQTGVFEPGFLLNQRWAGVQNRGNAANDLLGTPTYQAAIPSMEAAVDNPSVGDMADYTRKISGLFVPPASGSYVFFTCSDDASDLYVSTDATATSKRLVAQETGWSNPWNWTGVGDLAAANTGASIAPQKRSDTWTNAAGVAPYASGISLIGGNKYYIEVDMQQGTGGGNVEVNYKLFADADPPNGNGTFSAAADSRLTGTAIGMNAPKSSWVNFTLQPTNTAAPAGEANTATFYAQGNTDSQVPVGSIRSTGGGSPTEVANQYVFFQWYKNGAAIAGATTTSYTQTGIRASDNGAQFTCQMRSLGYGTPPANRVWSNSLPATLSVASDPTVPAITYSGYYLGTEPFGPQNWISITFSIPMDPTTLTNPANYAVSGTTVTGVQVSADGRHVQISVNDMPTGTPTVTITGARTWSNVGLAVNTVQAHALPAGFIFQDIGLDDGTTGELDPALPSKLYLDGPRAYTIAALGTDIWNTEDGFNFLYEQKTGDFDVVLRQTAYSLVNTWAKCGLMVREEIDPRLTATPGASRNWNIVNDPPNLPVLSGGTLGANAVECNWRTNNSTASAGWGNGTAMAPQYPNAWVRLKRVGQVITAFAGNNGATWTQMAQMDCTARPDTGTLPTTLYIGICTTGHQDANQINSANPAFYNYASVDNYNSAYVEPPPAQTLTALLSGGNIVVSWAPTGGTLQQSTDLVNWTDAGTANPSTIPATGPAKFFRVRTP